jgi:membrane protein insertase Oxa1/YidC/SpoIIIJ
MDFHFFVIDGRNFFSQGQLLLVVNLNFLLQRIDACFQLLRHGLFQLLHELLIRNLFLKLYKRDTTQQAKMKFWQPETCEYFSRTEKLRD